MAFFGSGAVFLIVVVVLDRKCKTFVGSRVAKFRLISCVLCLIMVVSLALVLLLGEEYSLTGYRLVGVGLEIAVYYLWISAIMSLTIDLKGFFFNIQVVHTGTPESYELES